MTDQDNLRDRIAKVHFAKAAELAAEQVGLDEPVKWEELTDRNRGNCLAEAQAVIDDLHLESYPFTRHDGHTTTHVHGWMGEQQ